MEGSPFIYYESKRRRCAICWKPVVLKCIEGDWQIVCLNDCEPGGHVTEEYVERREREDSVNAFVVAKAYPELGKKEQPDENNKPKSLW